jgi:hypothetical protein
MSVQHHAVFDTVSWSSKTHISYPSGRNYLRSGSKGIDYSALSAFARAYMKSAQKNGMLVFGVGGSFLNLLKVVNCLFFMTYYTFTIVGRLTTLMSDYLLPPRGNARHPHFCSYLLSMSDVRLSPSADPRLLPLHWQPFNSGFSKCPRSRQYWSPTSHC